RTHHPYGPQASPNRPIHLPPPPVLHRCNPQQRLLLRPHLPAGALECFHPPRLPCSIRSFAKQSRSPHICARCPDRVLEHAGVCPDDTLWYCVPCEERGGDVKESFWERLGCLC
ncbi:hypothetical protein BGZ47_004070, partial [Haplosporangium gracile]